MVSRTIGCLLGTCVTAADAKVVSLTIGCLLGAYVTAADAKRAACTMGELLSSETAVLLLSKRMLG